jgi:hypothetical protein
MQACREARDCGLKLKMHYYQFLNQTWRRGPHDSRHYINIDLDTIWLKDCFPVSIPSQVPLFCGRCLRSSLFPIISDGDRPECENISRLRRLAIHENFWVDPEEFTRGGLDDWDVGTTNILWYLNV